VVYGSKRVAVREANSVHDDKVNHTTVQYIAKEGDVESLYVQDIKNSAWWLLPTISGPTTWLWAIGTHGIRTKREINYKLM
jgi:hypothetical protein